MSEPQIRSFPQQWRWKGRTHTLQNNGPVSNSPARKQRAHRAESRDASEDGFTGPGVCLRPLFLWDETQASAWAERDAGDPPLTRRLQEGPCSGRRFSLCLCRRESAACLDGGDVRFPVEGKNSKGVNPRPHLIAGETGPAQWDYTRPSWSHVTAASTQHPVLAYVTKR